ncbi:MAG: hypothetical protein R6U44_10690 [Archaeoglobaceae archaeon]
MLEDEYRRLLDRVIGIENIEGFREDLKERFLRNRDITSGKSINRSEKRLSIRRAIGEAKSRQKKIELFAFVMGIVMTVAGLVFTFPLTGLPGIYFAVLGLEVSFRKVTIDILAYRHICRSARDEEVVFMEAWNRAILRNTFSLAGVPFIALIMRVHRKGYERGMAFLERWLFSNK